MPRTPLHQTHLVVVAILFAVFVLVLLFTEVRNFDDTLMQSRAQTQQQLQREFESLRIQSTSNFTQLQQQLYNEFSNTRAWSDAQLSQLSRVLNASLRETKKLQGAQQTVLSASVDESEKINHLAQQMMQLTDKISSVPNLAQLQQQVRDKFENANALSNAQTEKLDATQKKILRKAVKASKRMSYMAQQMTHLASDNMASKMARSTNDHTTHHKPITFEALHANGKVKRKAKEVDVYHSYRWLLRDSATHANYASTIPKIINKIYYQHDGTIYGDLNSHASIKEAHESWHINNPGYQIRYFDVFTSRAYLKKYFHPIMLRAFDCLQVYAYKSDFFRILLLYAEGGWYSDWKQVCTKPNALQSIQEGRHVSFFATRDETGHANGCMANAFIGSVAKHSILRHMIATMLQNVQQKHYGTGTLHPFGPCLLGDAVSSFLRRHTEMVTKDVLLGTFKDMQFYVNETQFVLHKCTNCDQSQAWHNGNNYNTAYENRQLYCEDANSLYLT